MRKYHFTNEDIELSGLDNQTTYIFTKIYNIFKSINKNEICSTSQILIDENKNYISIKLNSSKGNKPTISIDIFDIYLDIFVANEELFIQRSFNPTDGIINELNFVLYSNIKEIITLNNKGEINSCKLIFYYKNKIINEIGKIGFKNPFKRYQKKIKRYEPWLVENLG